MIIIYEKDSKKVINITSGNYGDEDVKSAIGDDKDFISVESIPEYNIYRQELQVINNELKVVDRVLDSFQLKEIERIEIEQKVAILQNKLSETDYIAYKLSEASTEAILTSDNSKLNDLYEEYKEILKNRQEWRDEISTLREQLSLII